MVSLYPNMRVDQVSDKVREAILLSDIKWREVDYMEAARYIALNLTAEEVLKTGLKRVLPWRRGKRGTKQGLRGEGPRGPEIGDTEQWCFPEVVLTEEEKKEIVALAVSMATRAMFRLHFYKFGGKIFRQL